MANSVTAFFATFLSALKQFGFSLDANNALIDHRDRDSQLCFLHHDHIYQYFAPDSEGSWNQVKTTAVEEYKLYVLHIWYRHRYISNLATGPWGTCPYAHPISCLTTSLPKYRLNMASNISRIDMNTWLSRCVPFW